MTPQRHPSNLTRAASSRRQGTGQIHTVTDRLVRSSRLEEHTVPDGRWRLPRPRCHPSSVRTSAASSRRQETGQIQTVASLPEVPSRPEEHTVPAGRWGLLTSQWDALHQAVHR